MTTIAHTTAPLAAIHAVTRSSPAFRTFRAFADACIAHLPNTATQDDAEQLRAILDAAHNHRGSMLYRMTYAYSLALHCADNPLER